jgi:FkbM family methyltransferase
MGAFGESSYKRALTRLLDRPGGRLLLGKAATWMARRAAGDDTEIAYVDGLWTHRVGPNFFPDNPRFNYTPPDFNTWKGQLERYVCETRDFWLQHYRPQEGDVVIDVGAGRGEDTLTFSRAVGETGRVIAIEAHPLSFEILKKFCRLNRLNNVTPVHLALMDKPGTVRIAESKSSWMENAVEHGDGSSGIEVQAGTLDDLCAQQRTTDIAFLKMNVEGAERFALLGMESVMPRIREICVACHDFRAELGHGERFRTRAFVGQFLVQRGFTIASRPNDSRDYVRDHVFGLRGSSKL